MGKSDLEYAFLNRWLTLTNELEPMHDYPFVRDVVGHGPGIRKRLKDAGLKDWRFDWAWVEQKVAVECEGGIWTAGRHVRGSGYEGDCIKYNFAQAQGWSLYRFTAGMLDRDPIGCINQVEAAVKGGADDLMPCGHSRESVRGDGMTHWCAECEGEIPFTDPLDEVIERWRERTLAGLNHTPEQMQAMYDEMKEAQRDAQNRIEGQD